MNTIKVCHGFTCSSRQATGIFAALKQHFTGHNHEVIICPCTGNCELSNNVVVNGEILHHQTPQRVTQSVERELDKQKAQAERDAIPISEGETDELLGL